MAPFTLTPVDAPDAPSTEPSFSSDPLRFLRVATLDTDEAATNYVQTVLGRRAPSQVAACARLFYGIPHGPRLGGGHDLSKQNHALHSDVEAFLNAIDSLHDFGSSVWNALSPRFPTEICAKPTDDMKVMRKLARLPSLTFDAPLENPCFGADLDHAFPFAASFAKITTQTPMNKLYLRHEDSVVVRPAGRPNFRDRSTRVSPKK